MRINGGIVDDQGLMNKSSSSTPKIYVDEQGDVR